MFVPLLRILDLSEIEYIDCHSIDLCRTLHLHDRRPGQWFPSWQHGFRKCSFLELHNRECFCVCPLGFRCLCSFTNPSFSPLWFYCKQGAHCQKGMVFSVNPTSDKTHALFKTAAASAPSTANGTTTSTPPNGAIVNGRSVGAVMLATFGVVLGML